MKKYFHFNIFKLFFKSYLFLLLVVFFISGQILKLAQRCSLCSTEGQNRRPSSIIVVNLGSLFKMEQ